MNALDKVRSRRSPLSKEDFLVDALLASLSDLYEAEEMPTYSAATYVTPENYVVQYLKSKFGADNAAYKYIATILA